MYPQDSVAGGWGGWVQSRVREAARHVPGTEDKGAEERHMCDFV